MEYDLLVTYTAQLQGAFAKLIGAMEPLEELHMPCTLCGMETDPLNNLFLLTDLIAGTQAYRNYRAQHFIPVHYGDIRFCNGTPEMAQYLKGNRLLAVDMREEEPPAQWTASLEEAMAQTFRLFGARNKKICFDLVMHNGVWVQRYWCRPFEQVFKLKLKLL